MGTLESEKAELEKLIKNYANAGKFLCNCPQCNVAFERCAFVDRVRDPLAWVTLRTLNRHGKGYAGRVEFGNAEVLENCLEELRQKYSGPPGRFRNYWCTLLQLTTSIFSYGVYSCAHQNPCSSLPCKEVRSHVCK
jgi:hypothetical protein